MQNKLVVYEVETEDDNETRDLFIRLQGSTPLTPQDKRDSWPGKFPEFVLRIGGKFNVPKWYGHDLFKKLARVSSESRRRQLVAQIFMLFWTIRNKNQFCDINSVNIDLFYHTHIDFDEHSEDAKRFESICDTLYFALQGHPKVFGHYMIHLFLFVDSLIEEYAKVGSKIWQRI